MDRWREDLALAIRASNSLSDAEVRLNDWRKQHEADEELRALVFQSAAKAYMAGQLFVRQVEVPEATRALADEGTFGPAFTELPFDEAIRAFAERFMVEPEVFYSDLDGIRQRAWTATHLASGTVRRKAYEALLRALSGPGEFGGTDLDGFAAAVLSEEISLGIEPSSPGYLRTVFDTNVSANYGAGRFRQITEPDVVEARPWVEYRATMDSHTRQAHAELHRAVWPASSTEWHVIAPPNDFNCRCTLLTRDADEVSEKAKAKGQRMLSTLSTVPHWSFSGPPDALLRLDGVTPE